MNTNETLSAAFDGECSEAELDRLLADMDRDPALMAEWSRLCARRDLREGTRLQPPVADWTASLMAAVRAEPAPIQAAHPKVQPLLRRRRPLWQPLGGLAVAASAALVAIALTLGQEGTVPGAEPAAVPVVVPAAPARDLRMASQTVPESSATQDDQWLANRYLIEHHNAVGGPMGGTLRYARFATHSTDGVRPANLLDEGRR